MKSTSLEFKWYDRTGVTYLFTFDFGNRNDREWVKQVVAEAATTFFDKYTDQVGTLPGIRICQAGKGAKEGTSLTWLNLWYNEECIRTDLSFDEIVENLSSQVSGCIEHRGS